jgi:hypothetical protein
VAASRRSFILLVALRQFYASLVPDFISIVRFVPFE